MDLKEECASVKVQANNWSIKCCGILCLNLKDILGMLNADIQFQQMPDLSLLISSLRTSVSQRNETCCQDYFDVIFKKRLWMPVCLCDMCIIFSFSGVNK